MPYIKGDFGFSIVKSKNVTEDRLYKYWRFRMMFVMFIGYASFYFLRHNWSFAAPEMETSLGISQNDLGIIATVSGVIYGVGRFISGIIEDRSSARLFMVIGLLLASAMNFCMGASSTFYAFLLIWTLNSCFLSTGAPACASMLTHWFTPQELGTKWAIWSSSQQVGMAIVGFLAATVIQRSGWRYAFYAPSVICIVLAIFLAVGLRDKPEKAGLKNVEEFKNVGSAVNDECAGMTSTQILFEKVLNNKMVWTMCLANMFLYVARMGFLFWAPMFLLKAKGINAEQSAFHISMFNAAGIFGAISAGSLSDRLFEGRRGRAGFFFMIGLALACSALLFLPPHAHIMTSVICFLVGFFASGPQVMVSVAAVDLSSKRAAGAASGITGTFGYIGTAIAGVGLTTVADGRFGWQGAFAFMGIAAISGAMCFLFTWNARAKSFDQPQSNNATEKKAA